MAILKFAPNIFMLPSCDLCALVTMNLNWENTNGSIIRTLFACKYMNTIKVLFGFKFKQ